MEARSGPGGFRRLPGAHLQLGREVRNVLSRTFHPWATLASFIAQFFFSNCFGQSSPPCLARKTELRFRGGKYWYGRLGQERPPHNDSVHSSQDSPQRAFSSPLWRFLVYRAKPRKEDGGKLTRSFGGRCIKVQTAFLIPASFNGSRGARPGGPTACKMVSYKTKLTRSRTKLFGGGSCVIISLRMLQKG